MKEIVMKRYVTLAIVATGILCVAETAGATNGYFSHGYGTRLKGMAGAGVALAEDALAPATNPAGVAFLGPRLDVGIAIFHPNREYTVEGAPSGYPGTFGLAPGTVKSGSDAFAIPYLARLWRAGEKSGLALSVYGNGGMNTSYPSATFGGSTVGVDLAQLFATGTVARQVLPGQAIGVTGIFAYQRFEASGLQAFAAFSSDPAALTNKGHAPAVGGGLRVGYQGRLHPLLTVGAAYQSRLWMSKFGDYAGLFCDHGEFDIPSNWTAGLALHPRRAWDVAFDVQRVNYSDVHSIGHPLLPNLMEVPLGGEGAAGFGWHDITTYKTGIQARAGDAWTFRGGYSVGDQPIPDTQVLFNILAPGVIERHATLGLTRSLGSRREMSLAVTRAFSTRVEGANPLEAPGQQRIELRMDQWEVEVGLSML